MKNILSIVLLALAIGLQAQGSFNVNSFEFTKGDRTLFYEKSDLALVYYPASSTLDVLQGENRKLLSSANLTDYSVDVDYLRSNVFGLNGNITIGTTSVIVHENSIEIEKNGKITFIAKSDSYWIYYADKNQVDIESADHRLHLWSGYLTDVTMPGAATNADKLEYIRSSTFLSASSGGGASQSYVQDIHTTVAGGNTVTTALSLSNLALVSVFRNGVKQIVGSGLTISGSTITFSTAFLDGEEIEIQKLQ